MTTTHSHPPAERDVLVVIPAFRNPDQLARCLDAVRRQTCAARVDVYVRDNSEDNIYFTAAINEGLKHGLANPAIRFFLILNQDCYLKEDAIEHLLMCLSQNPSVGICAPIQLDSENPENVIWGGSTKSFPAGECYLGSIDEAPQGPFLIPWASGAAAMIRRDVVVEIGIMDRNMRFICSDSDYSFTARARGWQIACLPAARCIHEMGAARVRSGNEIRKIMREDVAYFADKWITGNLFLRLEHDPDKRDVAELRRQCDTYLEWLSAD